MNIKESILKWQRTDLLLTNSLFIMASSLILAPINFLFWLLVTKFYPADQVGLAASLLSLTLWVGLFSRLGLEEGLRRYIPENNINRNTLINSSLIMVTLCSLGVGLIVFILLSFLVPSYTFIRSNIIIIVTLIGLSVVNSVFSILDNVFIGKIQSSLVFIRQVSLSIKIIFVLFFTAFGTFGILLGMGLASWSICLIFTVIVLPYIIPSFKFSFSIKLSIIRDFSLYSLKNQIANILISLPGSFLPILVVTIISPEVGGYFYICWMISSVIYMIPGAIGISFMVNSINEPNKIEKKFRKSILYILLLLLPLIVGTILFGEFILGLFGSNYINESLSFLQITALAGFPVAINSLYSSFCRLKKKIGKIILINFIIASVTFFGSYITLPIRGLIGLGLVWLIIQSLVAAVVLIEFIYHSFFFKKKKIGVKRCLVM